MQISRLGRDPPSEFHATSAQLRMLNKVGCVMEPSCFHQKRVWQPMAWNRNQLSVAALRVSWPAEPGLQLMSSFSVGFVGGWLEG